MSSDRIAVATECPSCGAPLDFREGSNAIRCDHCGTNLLVTGRRRVLSYWIPPRVEADRARRAAHDAELSEGKPARIGEAALWFLPYWRITGQEIRTEWTQPPVEAGERRESRGLAEALASALPSRDPGEGRREFRDRSIEKNFLATDLVPLVPYSIGVRAAVLRLELFRRAPIAELGTIVAPTIPGDAALEIGTRTLGEARILQRELLAVRLAIVYFPFWTTEISRPAGARSTLVDAVTGGIAQRDLAPDWTEKLGRPPSGDSETVGFRPLLCPNCGWDLPLRADDCVLCCRGCKRAWEIDGADLVETPTDVAAATDARSRGPARHLPFWRLSSESGERLTPAFRFRRLKSLVDLATSYARKPPQVQTTAEEPPELTGAYFDRTDARALSRFVDAEKPPRDTRAALVWIPYRADGYSLVDPFFGLGLAKNLFV